LWHKVLDVYLYPGSVLISALLATIASVALVRRGHRLSALVWLGAWGTGSAIELAGKHLLTRPSLHWTNGHIRLDVVAFANSYPSGHTVRSVVTVAILGYVWPKARAPLAVWLAFVPVCLVVVAAHTITDVIGGLLLGGLVVLVAHAMIRAWTPSQAYSASSSGESSETRRWSWPTSQAKRSSSPPES
jgi:membrane-associated phospholipid phosphatase